MRYLRRNRKPDARVTAARREAEVSRERLHATRMQIIGPLQEMAARNGFADLIRQSLLEGRDHR